MVGQRGWPLWLSICCSGSPNVAVVTGGHWHFQCSSDTICFLYFLAQRKRLRKQFNREREHTHISTLQMEPLGCLLFRKHRWGCVFGIAEVPVWIQQSALMLLSERSWFCDKGIKIFKSSTITTTKIIIEKSLTLIKDCVQQFHFNKHFIYWWPKLPSPSLKITTDINLGPLNTKSTANQLKT